MIQKPQKIIKVLSAGETSNTNNPEQYTGKNPKGWDGEKDKIILHLCADTGSDTKPYKDAGYTVILVGSEIGVENYTPPENVHGIIANPVCTEFSTARSNGKARNPEQGMFLVKECMRIIEQAKPKWWIIENPAKGSKSAQIIANPAGDWTIGGFDADAGVTGRKIVVDAYGPRVPVGGGAFSGKDATKVDRSAAYLARYIAVHTLTRPQYRYANECIVKVAYAIGIAEPLDITILVDGVECKVSSIHKQMLKPKEIIDFLHLREPVYESTARDGHFGVGQRWG